MLLYGGGTAQRLNNRKHQRNYVADVCGSSAPHSDNSLAAVPLFQHDLDVPMVVDEPAAEGNASGVRCVEQVLGLAVGVEMGRHRARTRARAEIAHHADSDTLVRRVVVVAVGLMQLDVEIAAGNRCMCRRTVDAQRQSCC